MGGIQNLAPNVYNIRPDDESDEEVFIKAAGSSYNGVERHVLMYWDNGTLNQARVRAGYRARRNSGRLHLQVPRSASFIDRCSTRTRLSSWRVQLRGERYNTRAGKESRV